jgi:hypothetical protein
MHPDHEILSPSDFTELNKQVWMNSEPPRPRVLNLGRNHPDQRSFVDWQRVSYLRTMQHDKICKWESLAAGIPDDWAADRMMEEILYINTI